MMIKNVKLIQIALIEGFVRHIKNTWFGTTGSQVRILSSRQKGLLIISVSLFLFFVHVSGWGEDPAGKKWDLLS